jgi:regulator of protease activity HflC (stomatin/prohibitin superfamily)
MSNYNPQPVDIRKIRPFIIFGIVLVVLLISWSRITVTIPAGHAGLIYQTFSGGITTDEPALGQGFHLIAPWNHVVIYEIRQQETTVSLTALSSNLLDIKLDVTIFHEPILSELANLEVKRGSNYVERVIIPAMRAVTRESIAQYLPEEINTTRREEIQLQVEEEMRKRLNMNYIELNDVLIRNIELPEKLRASIERKLQQEQESLEYEFRIEKAQKEAERKKIEAEGIQDFQQIVSKSITQDLLRWKGIEATEALAQSTNSKVVVIGSGKDGLPIILGGN